MLEAIQRFLQAAEPFTLDGGEIRIELPLSLFNRLWRDGEMGRWFRDASLDNTVMPQTIKVREGWMTAICALRR